VPADLRLVAHAAERHADELASERTRDRLADRRLARAGRADQRQDRAGLLVLGDAAVGAQLAHGDVLGDAVLHVLEAGVVLVEHLARVHRVEPLRRALLPRHGDQPVEVGADDRRLGGLLAHLLEAPELLLGLLADFVGHARFLDLHAVLVHDGAVVLAELLADRLHLPAQEVLALLLLGAALHVLADPAADVELGQRLALEAQRQLEPLLDVDRLEQLDLLLEVEVGRVAGRVGERARLRDRAQKRRDAAVVAAELEDLLDHGAVVALEVAGLAVDGVVVEDLLDVDAQLAAQAAAGRARDAAVEPHQLDRRRAAGQPHAVDDIGDGADLGEVAVVAGDQQDALLIAHVDRERHVHIREDDDVVEGYEQ
jgi:hypothetical protein